MIGAMSTVDSGPMSAYPRTVCVVSAVNPYPPRTGKTVVLAGFLDYWVRRVGAENVHYLVVDSEDPEPGDFPCRVIRLDPPRRREMLRALATRTLTGRAPIQESVLRGETLQQAIAARLAETRPDLVLFDTVRLGQYAELLDAPPGQDRVIYLDDLFSNRYRTMLRAGRRHRDIRYDALGGFARFIPAIVRPLVNLRPVQRGLLAVEARLIEASEDRAARSFRRSFLINADETAELRRRAGSSGVHTTPPALVPPGRSRTWDGSATLVSLGNLTLPHNDDGVRWLLRTCWPEITRRRPDVRLDIIGRGARPELVSLAARFPNVHLMGYVDSLDEALQGAAMLVAPMRFGSGIKIKIVDAAARGLPVVTSTIGAHGIGTGPTEGMIVADEPGAFVDGVLAALDPATNATLSAAGRRNFDEHFAPDVVRRAYDHAFARP